jgi:O-antigen/teichoic acid export membrane protein
MEGRVRPNIIAAIIRTGSTGAVLFLAPAILGKVDFGLYSYAYWIAFFSLQVGLFGIPSLICRSPQRAALPLTAFIALALTVQTIVFLVLFGSSKIDTPLAIKFAAATISCFGVGNALILAICRQRSQFQFILISELAAGLMRLLSVAYLYWRKDITPHSLLFAEGSCQGVQLLVLFFIGRGKLIDRAKVSNISMAGLREVVGLGILGLVDAVLWQRAETWFLALTANSADSIATFSFALRIATAGVFIPAAVIDAWFPTVAITDSMQEVRRMLKRFTKFYTIYAFTVGLAALALVISVYPQYLCAEAVILLVFRVCEGVFGFASAVVYARKGESLLWTAIAASACVSIIANLLLTPKYSLMGATISYILAHTVLAGATVAVYIIVTRREIRLGRLIPVIVEAKR